MVGGIEHRPLHLFVLVSDLGRNKAPYFLALLNGDRSCAFRLGAKDFIEDVVRDRGDEIVSAGELLRGPIQGLGLKLANLVHECLHFRLVDCDKVRR